MRRLEPFDIRSGAFSSSRKSDSTDLMRQPIFHFGLQPRIVRSSVASFSCNSSPGAGLCLTCCSLESGPQFIAHAPQSRRFLFGFG